MMSRFFILSLIAATIHPVAETGAQEFMIRFQPSSPSDLPAELIPSTPSLQIEPTPRYPGQKPYVVQQPYVVQKQYMVQKSSVVCPNYCVTYHHHGRFRRSCCGHCVPSKMILPVQDPIRCGCTAEICVTVPGCCQGMPYAHSKIGLLGRGIVTYKWPSGYMVEVIFKKMSPDVMVHTIAR